MPILTCATWNVHRARGSDGQVDPDRVVATLARDVSPVGRHQVLALQEADGECPPHAGLLDLDRIAAATGLRHVHDSPEMRWGAQSHGFLGAILFLHPAISVTGRDVIDLPGHCHRGAVVVDVGLGGVPVRIITAHLSLSQPLRMVQMRIIGQYLRRRPPMQTILLGDLNEWRPWLGLAFAQPLLGRRFEGGARRTFPAHWPVLPLDRILSDRAGAVRDLRALDTAAIRAASDHLPLTASVVVG
ncbi:endonuclease/exonuclease/phosphatase family protein [Yoonia sp.]|uniref:endonuclease/exonuclease/phosphatase family protein n=1 Tax=Yoonia sp. TaxID=2212373 RepID=UPI003919783F